MCQWHKRFLAVSALVVSLVSPAAFAAMSITATIKGATQGLFTGDIGKNGITVTAYNFGVMSPRDPASGLPTGKRQYSPITITKVWDPASTEILMALANNETLVNVTIAFSRPTVSGSTQVFQTVKLTNASIVQVNQYTKPSTTNPGVPAPVALEDVSFIFQKIEVDSNVNGSMFVDYAEAAP